MFEYKKYRIYFSYTKKEQYDKAIEMIKRFFNAFTIYDAQGFWKGISEPSIIVEIINNRVIENQITLLCQRLRDICKQECVMLTKQEIEMEFI